jgi:hypothetical protein
MNKKYVIAIVFINILCILHAVEPVHRFGFYGKLNPGQGSCWLSNHEVVVDGWYFNRNTNRFIPPYTGGFMELSPYNNKTGFYYSAQYIYLTDIEDYANGIPPRIIPIPVNFPPLNGAAAWINSNEILFLSRIPGEEEDWGFDKYKYLTYSLADNTWKELKGMGFDYFGKIVSMCGSGENYFLLEERHPEISFYIYRLMKYLPGTGSFISYHEHSEIGGSGVSSSGIQYEVNVIEGGDIYYSGIIDRTCLVRDACGIFIKSIVFPDRPGTRGFRNAVLSPNALSLMVVEGRDPVIGPESREHPLTEVLIFDERIQQSYNWKIILNEEFGIEHAAYRIPYDAEVIISHLFVKNSIQENDTTRDIIRKWIMFLNRHKTEVKSNNWIIPKKGSFLYMLGLGNGLFNIEVETVK